MAEKQRRLIKKYPNRRLYDTASSCYITLADVRDLVLGQEEFQVVDAKSGDDLTRSILLQIILEEESSGGSPMFNSDLLAQMIRFYGNAMQGFMGNYLGNNITAFTEMQQKLQEQSKGLHGDSAMGKDLWLQFLNFQGPALQSMMGAYTEQSKRMFAQMQEQMDTQTRTMLSNFQFPAYGDPKDREKK